MRITHEEGGKKWRIRFHVVIEDEDASTDFFWKELKACLDANWTKTESDEGTEMGIIDYDPFTYFNATYEKDGITIELKNISKLEYASDEFTVLIYNELN